MTTVTDDNNSLESGGQGAISREQVCRSIKDRHARGIMQTPVGTHIVSINPSHYLQAGGILHSSSDAPIRTALMDCLRRMSIVRPKGKGTGPAKGKEDDAGADPNDTDHSMFVVFGLSGTGKTTIVNQLIRLVSLECIDYVRPVDHNSLGELSVQLSAIGTVLGPLGHAKTAMNDDSSRFAKLIVVYPELGRAHIKTYLLERSRVTAQNDKEGSLHIYHMLHRFASSLNHNGEESNFPEDLNGLWGELLRQVIADVTESDKNQPGLRYLKQPQVGGGSVSLFDWVNALRSFALDEGEIVNLLEILSGVLILGDNPESTARLWGLNAGDWEPKVKFGTGAKITAKTEPGIKRVWDSLARTVHQSTFEWLVSRMNAKLGAPQEVDTVKAKSISFLDIYGFENLPLNAFEQICINWTNERLNRQVNETFIDSLRRIYETEAISTDLMDKISASTVTSLQDECLAFLGSPTDSLRAVLNDIQPTLDSRIDDANCMKALRDLRAKLPVAKGQSTPPAWTVSPTTHSQSRHAFDMPASDTNHSTQTLAIHHFAGVSTYDMTGCVERNSETVDGTLLEWMAQTTSNHLLRDILTSKRQNSKKGSRSSVYRAHSQSLDDLMKQVRTSHVISVGTVRIDETTAAASSFPSAVDSDSRSRSGASPIQLNDSGLNERVNNLYHEEVVWRQLQFSGVENRIRICRQLPTKVLPKLDFVCLYALLLNPVGAVIQDRIDAGLPLVESVEDISDLEDNVDDFCLKIIDTRSSRRATGNPPGYLLGSHSVLFTPELSDELDLRSAETKRLISQLKEEKKKREDQARSDKLLSDREQSAAVESRAADQTRLEVIDDQGQLEDVELTQGSISMKSLYAEFDPDSDLGDHSTPRMDRSHIGIRRPTFFDDADADDQSFSNVRPLSGADLGVSLRKSGRRHSFRPDVTTLGDLEFLDDSVALAVGDVSDGPTTSVDSDPRSRKSDYECGWYVLTYYVEHLPTQYWQRGWSVETIARRLQGLLPADTSGNCRIEKGQTHGNIDRLARVLLTRMKKSLERSDQSLTVAKPLDIALMYWTQAIRVYSLSPSGFGDALNSSRDRHEIMIHDLCVALSDFISKHSDWTTEGLKQIASSGRSKSRKDLIKDIAEHVQYSYGTFGYLASSACESQLEACRQARKAFMTPLWLDCVSTVDGWFKGAVPVNFGTADDIMRRDIHLFLDSFQKAKCLLSTEDEHTWQAHRNAHPKTTGRNLSISGYGEARHLRNSVLSLLGLYSASSSEEADPVIERLPRIQDIFKESPYSGSKHSDYWADIAQTLDGGDMYTKGWKALEDLGCVTPSS